MEGAGASERRARFTGPGPCGTIGAVQWKQIVKLGRELPEVAEDLWFRTPALKVRGKSFVRLKEDGENVVFMLESVDEQEALCEAMGDVYWITDHYRGYPAVMARLATLTEAECRLRLERAWRLKAPKKLLAATDAAPAPRPAAKPRHPPAPRPAAKPKRPPALPSAAKPRRPATKPKRPPAQPKRPPAQPKRSAAKPKRPPPPARRS